MNNEFLLNGFFISFVITTVLLIFGIPILKNIKIGQMIREDGPKNHIIKQGTPTMGGIMMLIGFSLSFIIVGISSYNIDIVDILKCLFPCYVYLLIGLFDDLLIILKHNNNGISPKMKIVLQIIGIILYYFIFLKDHRTIVNVFSYKVDFKQFYFFFVLLIYVSSTNAVNLTDGLDGLASGLLIICFIATLILGIVKDKIIIVLFSVTIIASLLSFLMFNHNPAKIFMGNAGSLMFGSILATMMILLEEEMLIVIIGIVFIIETLSVILQVTYYKISKGKRIFLMAPLHHHFEKKGMNEWSVDFLFWIVGLIALLFFVFGVLYI